MNTKHQEYLRNQIAEHGAAIRRCREAIKEQERSIDHHTRMIFNLEERYKCSHIAAIKCFDINNIPMMCCPDCKLVVTL